jgi:hypothetical protein
MGDERRSARVARKNLDKMLGILGDNERISPELTHAFA